MVEGYAFGFAGTACDVVLAGETVLELRGEGGFDAAATHVDGVFGAVHDVVDADAVVFKEYWQQGKIN